MPDFHEPTIATLMSETLLDADKVGSAAHGFQAKECIQVVLKVTDANSVVDDKLDVYVDISPDRGTTWIPVIRFTQIDGDNALASPWVEVAELLPKWAAPATATVDASGALAEAAVRPYLLGTSLRARADITDGAGDHTFSFEVTAIGR